MNDDAAIPKLPSAAVAFCRLWQRTLPSGHLAYTGVLGGARIELLPNPKRRDPADATHLLCFAKRPPRADEAPPSPIIEGET